MNPSTIPVLKKQCPYCQAGNHPDSEKCWLCFAPLPKGTVGVTQIPSTPPSPVDPAHGAFFEVYFAVLFFLALGAMGIVTVGAFLSDPSLGMVTLVAIAPVVLVTGITMAIRYSSTGKVDYLRGVLAMAVTVLVTVGLAVILIAVGIILLFVMCLNELSRL